MFYVNKYNFLNEKDRLVLYQDNSYFSKLIIIKDENIIKLVKRIY
mgnify:CR=1 FL=1